LFEAIGFLFYSPLFTAVRGIYASAAATIRQLLALHDDHELVLYETDGILEYA
jgi:hypothetical protein